jgi:group I intron endonuclease
MKEQRIIYSLKCPFTNEVHYIGKSEQGMLRPLSHISNSHSDKINEWVGELKQLGYVPNVEICEYVPLEENITEREKYWIKHVKENGYQLTNMTDGGDGNNNQVFNEETREKHRIRMTGKVFSEKTRNLISQRLTGKKVSAETRKKLSDLNKGKACSIVVKEKLSYKVDQYDLNGNFIQTFNSLTKAAESVNARKSSLSNAMKRKKVKKFRGYLWEFQSKIKN